MTKKISCNLEFCTHTEGRIPPNRLSVATFAAQTAPESGSIERSSTPRHLQGSGTSTGGNQGVRIGQRFRSCCARGGLRNVENRSIEPASGGAEGSMPLPPRANRFCYPYLNQVENSPQGSQAGKPNLRPLENPTYGRELCRMA